MSTPTPLAVDLAHYYYCSQCNKIDNVESWLEGADQKKICPHCYIAGGYCEWPSEDAQLELSAIQTLKRGIKNDAEMANLHYTKALSQILENTIRDIALGEMMYDEVGYLIDTIIDTNQGYAQLEIVFESLLGFSLEDALYEVECEEYAETLNRIKEFPFSDLDACSDNEIESIMDLISTSIPDTLESFATVHNTYRRALWLH